LRGSDAAVARFAATAAGMRGRSDASRRAYPEPDEARNGARPRHHVQREESMRNIKLAVLALVPLFAVATTAVAQDVTTAPASAVSAPTKKQLRRANWHTETQVRKALTSTRGLTASDIRVVARGNTIALDGTVPDDSQIQLAQTAAQAAAPKKSVVNHLSVKEPGH
jgi:hypothetical protein